MRRRLFAALPCLAIAIAGCSSGSGDELPSGLVVRKLPAAPVARNDGAVVCVTDHKLVVWQLNTVEASGAAFDVSAQRWRALPKPFHGAFGGLVCHEAGASWLGFPPGSKLANPSQDFQLRDRTWTRRPPGPGDFSPPAVALGRDLFAIGRTGRENIGAFYDHGRNAWSPVVPPRDVRTLGYEPLLIAAGGDVIALYPHGDRIGQLVTLRWHVSDRRWERLPLSPDSWWFGGPYVVTNDDLILFNGMQPTEGGTDPARLAGMRLDLANGKWHRIADPPDIRFRDDLDGTRSQSIVVAWTGSAMLVWTGVEVPNTNARVDVPVLAYSPARDEWTTLGTMQAKGRCKTPTSNAVWFDGEMVFVCREGVVGLRPAHT